MSFAEDFIRSYMAADRMMRAREQDEQEREDRDIRRQQLKVEMGRLRVQDQIARRNMMLQQAQLMEGRPGEEIGIPERLREIIGQQKIPIAGVDIGMGTPTTEVSGRAPEPTVVPHEEIAIPGVEGLDVPGFQYRPRTTQEIQKQGIVAALIKMQNALDQKRMEKQLEAEFREPKFGEEEPYPPDVEEQKKRITQASQLLSPQAEQQRRRIATAGQGAVSARMEAGRESRERIAEANRKAQDIRAANRLLAQENRARETQGLPLLSSPPGSEIGKLERTAQGPGVRRWGHGGRMAVWLARQYLGQAGGDKETARAWADADGWQRR